MGAKLKDGVIKIACPLCLNWMHHEYVPEREIFVFCCPIDKVAIAADDPHLDRWDDARKQLKQEGNIPCPACNADMRFFSTSKNFMKVKCPKKKCGASAVIGDAPEDKVYIAPKSILQQ